MRTPKQRAVESLRGLLGRMEPRRVIVRAVVGDGAGNVAVPGYTNLYWVRIVGKASFLAQAYCDSLIPAHGMNVLCEEKVEENRKRYVIIGRPDTQGWFDDEPGYGQGSSVGAHHVSHEMGGPDLVNVGKGMLENLRATPTDPYSMAVYVSYDQNVMFGADCLEYDGGNSPNFTAPTWGERYDLLTIDSTGTLAITTGTEDWGNPAYPSVPFGKIPICYVLLNSGTTSINANMIYDCRPVFSIGAPGGDLWTDGGTYIYPTGDEAVTIGGATDPVAKLKVLDAAEQLRLAYDADSYVAFTVGNASTIIVMPAESGEVIFRPTTNGATFFQVQQADATPVFNVNTTDKRVGIATTSPAYPLDIIGSTNVLQMRLGNISATGNKFGGFVLYPYTSGEKDVVLLVANSLSTVNDAYWGGGSSAFLALTNQRFYTGATRTTTTGTQRLIITSGGLVGIGSAFSTPAGMLHIKANAAAEEGLIVQGAASQSANRLEIQDSASVVDVAIDADGNIQLRNNLEVRWYDNGNYVGFEAPALAADQIWVLPAADGNASDFLQTNGAGALTWAAGGGGAATGGTLLIFTPYCNEPPSSDYATLDTRNLHPCLDFDDTTNESAVFTGVMPQNYGGGGVTVYLHYAMATAVADTIDWDVAFERIGDQQQDIDADSFAAVQSVDGTTVPGTSGLVDVVSIAFTDGAQMDNVAAGELFRIKVTRDAANDDATGDAELLAVELRETP